MNIQLWFNKPYFITCIIAIISTLFFCFNEYFNDISHEYSWVYLYGGIYLALFFSYMLVRLSARIILNKKGVFYKEFFKKSSFNDYSEYKFIKKAYYGYYNNPIYYIVLSKRQLSGDELCHINNVPMSETVIHIRYNEKNYNAFMKILPQKQAEMLEKEFKSMRAPKINFIP